MKTNPLLQHLEETGRLDLLLPEERDLLRSAELRALSPPEQWDHLAANRRVGYWIVAVGGALRLLLLAGGAVAAFVFTADQLTGSPDPVVWLLLLVASIAVLWAARTMVALRRRLTDLGRPLPAFSELDLADEPP